MRIGASIIAVAVAGCAVAPPAIVEARDPTVGFDFRSVPRAPDVAAYPSVPEHVWSPIPAGRAMVVVKITNYPKQKPAVAPSFVRVLPSAPADLPPGAQVKVAKTIEEVLVSFAFDRSAVDSVGRAAIAKLIADAGGPSAVAAVSVDAYADGLGSDTYNDRLTERRALNVKSVLVGLGVPASAVATAAHGKHDPIASNESAEGRAANRRATVRTGVSNK